MSSKFYFFAFCRFVVFLVKFSAISYLEQQYSGGCGGGGGGGVGSGHY